MFISGIVCEFVADRKFQGRIDGASGQKGMKRRSWFSGSRKGKLPLPHVPASNPAAAGSEPNAWADMLGCANPKSEMGWHPQPVLPQPLCQRAHHRLVLRAVLRKTSEDNGARTIPLLGWTSGFHPSRGAFGELVHRCFQDAVWPQLPPAIAWIRETLSGLKSCSPVSRQMRAGTCSITMYRGLASTEFRPPRR